MSVLLDTHAWIWWTGNGGRLSDTERAALDRHAMRGELHIPAIAMWECQMLHAKGRLRLHIPFAEWLARATDDRFISVVPLDREVVMEMDRLPARFHGDPADRMIVATARRMRFSLATHDSAIRRSRLTRIWKASR